MDTACPAVARSPRRPSVRLHTPDPAPAAHGETAWPTTMPGRDPWILRVRTWTQQAWEADPDRPEGTRLGADGVRVLLTID